MRSRKLLIADAVAALLFAASAAIQLNDPDPAAWIAIYLAGALVAALGWRWIGGLIAALATAVAALVWAVAIAADIDQWVGWSRLVGPMEIEGGPVELAREALGLAMIAGYCVFVAARWRGLPSAR
jgi:hypothetical protein